MRLQQLSYVIEISESGSINKAAQRLFVSQPTLSTSIRELENELGFLLFERSPQGIQVTKEGKEFIETAERILSQVHHLREDYTLGNKTDEPAILRISSGIYSFASEALIRFYKSTFESFPRFSLSISETSRSVAIYDVINRNADIGIIHTKGSEDAVWRNNLERRGLSATFLFKSTPCVTFRNNHPLASLPEITEEAILGYPQVRLIMKNSDAYNWEGSSSFSLSDEFGRNIYTNSSGTLYNILSNTDAVFLGVTNYCITDFHPNLTTVPVPGDVNSWNVYCIKPANVPLGSYAQTFVETLKSIASTDTPIQTTF